MRNGCAMKTTGLILTALCVLSLGVEAREQTITELARQHKGRVGVDIRHEFSPADLPELVKGCDLIARVVVLDNGQARLSKDEKSMDSEFTVQVLDQFFSTRTLTPGQKIVVTKPGGTMTIEGYPITVREPDFPPFHANEEYILFLKFNAATSQYDVPYGAQGAFRNVGGVVEQVSKHFGIWNREGGRGRVPISEFTEELTRLLNSR
jgi:hypothetical protein